MMERSRSRLDPLSSLQVRDRDLQKQVDRLRNRDRSLPDWIDLTLAGAWVTFGAPEDDPGYWRDSSGIVRFRGVAKSGTVPSTLTTMGEGFRPAGKRRFPVVSNNVFGYISVTSAGVITVEAGNNTYIDIAAINYRAEL